MLKKSQINEYSDINKTSNENYITVYAYVSFPVIGEIFGHNRLRS